MFFIQKAFIKPKATSHKPTRFIVNLQPKHSDQIGPNTFDESYELLDRLVCVLTSYNLDFCSNDTADFFSFCQLYFHLDAFSGNEVAFVELQSVIYEISWAWLKNMTSLWMSHHLHSSQLS